MKKYLSAIALAAVVAVACNKETNVKENVAGGNKVTIRATLDESTKTTYASGKTFSWEQNDQIRVLTSDGTNTSFANFYADAAGASTTFSATLTDYYRPSGLAFYPTTLNPSFDSGSNEYTVTLGQVIPSSSNGDPLSVFPLVGTKNADDSYNFKTATGLLKFTVKYVPSDANYFTIYTNNTNQYLDGIFALNADNTISFDGYLSDGTGIYWNYIEPNEDGTAEIYAPAPLGTLKAGTVIAIEDADENALYELTTQKDITIQRNKVTEIAPIRVIRPVPYLQDAESGKDGWTFIDADGDGYNWEVSTGNTHSGINVLASASYDNTVGPLTPDNWAFTPPIQLADDTNYLSFWLTAQDQSYANEHYAVYITEEEPSSGSVPLSVVLLEQTYPAGTPFETGTKGYQRFAFEIPASYSGKVVYIGFRHFDCTDMYRLNLDDVEISNVAPVVAPPVVTSDEYKKWLGTWTVDDGNDQHTWVIEEDEPNVSYTVYGLWGYDFIPISASFNADNTFSIASQTVYGAYYLFAVVTNTTLYDLDPVMTATMSSDTEAVLEGDPTSGLDITGYYLADSNYSNYGWNDLPATMTKSVSAVITPAPKPSSVHTNELRKDNDRVIKDKSVKNLLPAAPANRKVVRSR